VSKTRVSLVLERSPPPCLFQCIDSDYVADRISPDLRFGNFPIRANGVAGIPEW